MIEHLVFSVCAPVQYVHPRILFFPSPCLPPPHFPPLQVLKHEYVKKPSLVGAGVFGLDDVFARIKPFVARNLRPLAAPAAYHGRPEAAARRSPGGAAGPSPPPLLYFASVDIRHCYDTVDQVRGRADREFQGLPVCAWVERQDMGGGRLWLSSGGEAVLLPFALCRCCCNIPDLYVRYLNFLLAWEFCSGLWPSVVVHTPKTSPCGMDPGHWGDLEIRVCL